MKTTKHITKLAETLFERALKNDSYTKENDREWMVDAKANQLNNIKEALLKGRFYVGVNTVSSSGMSRTLSLAYIKNNQLVHITDPEILKLAGCDKNGRISGCGMDMCFHAQYTLFQNLHSNYKQAHYQKRMADYRSL